MVNLNDARLTLDGNAGRIDILHGITLDVAKGETLALTGPSGSGKTTLLNAIGGLDELDSGEISIDGDRVDQLAKGGVGAAEC